MEKIYEPIGSVQSVHGLKGELVIRFDDVEVVLPASKKIFIYMHGTYVPYLIEGSRVMDGRAWVRLCHITTRTQAMRLQGNRVFMDKEDRVANQGEDYASMVGGVVVDVHHGVLGEVMGVHERFVQPCLCVRYKDDELLIPMHDAFIQSVKDKTITVKLPDDYIAALLGD